MAGESGGWLLGENWPLTTILHCRTVQMTRTYVAGAVVVARGGVATLVGSSIAQFSLAGVSSRVEFRSTSILAHPNLKPLSGVVLVSKWSTEEQKPPGFFKVRTCISL